MKSVTPGVTRPTTKEKNEKPREGHHRAASEPKESDNARRVWPRRRRATATATAARRLLPQYRGTVTNRRAPAITVASSFCAAALHEQNVGTCWRRPGASHDGFACAILARSFVRRRRNSPTHDIEMRKTRPRPRKENILIGTHSSPSSMCSS